MILLPFFPTSSTILLRETGEVSSIDGGPADMESARHVILSRALCTFEFYEAASELTPRQKRKAVLLHAEARAPFVTSGSAVFGGEGGFCIWWWDLARIEKILGRSAQTLRFTPESMAQEAGEGWRVVQGVDGHEAQHWREGRLTASQWRRNAFDDLRWQRFVESAPQWETPPPEASPASMRPVWRRRGTPPERLEQTTIWPRLEIAGWVAAGVAMTCAIGLWGHAARYREVASQRRDAAAQTQAAVTKVRTNTVLIRAAVANAPIPEHLIAAADLLVALETAGLEAASWESSAGKIRASARGETEIDALGARLEANPRLRNVAPLRANGMVVVTAEVETSATALADATP